MVPVGSSVMLEFVLAVQRYHVFAYPVYILLKTSLSGWMDGVKSRWLIVSKFGVFKVLVILLSFYILLYEKITLCYLHPPTNFKFILISFSKCKKILY